VRLHLLISEDLAHRALRDPCQADMAGCRAVLAGVAGQQSRRPELVRVSHILRLWHATDTSHVRASTVISGCLPGRGLSSSAAMAPNRMARAKQRWTV
jgi:hypothetical protein